MVLNLFLLDSASTNRRGLHSIFVRQTLVTLQVPFLSTIMTGSPILSSERYLVSSPCVRRYCATAPALTLKGLGATNGFSSVSAWIRNRPVDWHPTSRPSPSLIKSQVSMQVLAPEGSGLIWVIVAAITVIFLAFSLSVALEITCLQGSNTF